MRFVTLVSREAAHLTDGESGVNTLAATFFSLEEERGFLRGIRKIKQTDAMEIVARRASASSLMRESGCSSDRFKSAQHKLATLIYQRDCYASANFRRRVDNLLAASVKPSLANKGRTRSDADRTTAIERRDRSSIVEVLDVALATADATQVLASLRSGTQGRRWSSPRRALASGQQRSNMDCASETL